MKRNSYCNLVKACFFICILFLASCDTIKKREKLVSEVNKHFQENREMYNFLQNYFKEQNTYLGFAFNYNDDKITLKQSGSPIKIDSINQIINNKEVFDILVFMKKEQIQDISGNKEWIKVSMEESKIPCFSFWYREDFNPSAEEVTKKLENLHNTKTKNWLYILDGKWFIKGEACF